MRNIIFVDDEIQVLKSIRRVFADAGYNVQYCESAEEALESMNGVPADMIVTDMRMPGMNGTELLKIIKQKYPKTIRLVLSGYSDEKEVMSTLQSNLAKAYMFKPWSNDELLRVVRDNLNPEQTQLPKEILTYINNLEQLPTTGARYQQIRQCVEDNKDISIISAEIEKDQSLTAKVLQIVNSAYYGIKTGSVKKALSFIGTNELEDLVMSMEIMDCLTMADAGCEIAELIWNQAYYTNKIQYIIQEYFLNQKRKHANTTAGLLHKIGIVFMIKYYAHDYISLLNGTHETGNCNMLESEREKYGFSHPLLSAYLLRWWNAPEQIVEAAEWYHSPLEYGVNDKELVSIVHIAQHYASLYMDMAPFIPLQLETFEFLNLDKAAFEEKYRTFI